jgi:hypothetical protein
MAVIQISRIQVRRGKADSPTPSGLPQLSSGEIGWAIDDQRLWIGSGSVDEGAPAVENVEILTKKGFKEILDSFTASNYTYRLENLNNGQPIYPIGASVRTIQQKLDDTPVNITDFGVSFNQGNAVAASGSLDVTIATAISSLYYSGGASPALAPALNFPAGTFLLTATIYVPPHAVIRGAGKGKTIFIMTSTNTAILQTVGITPSNTVASYAEFSGVTIDKQPQNIEISGLTFKHDTGVAGNRAGQMVLVDWARNTRIRDCEFIGTYNSTTSISATNSAIEMRYTTVENIDIDNCSFSNLAVPIVSNYDINDIRISNNTFDTAAEGIQLGTNITGSNDQTTGPTNVKINKNHFTYILKSAIDVGMVNSAVTSNVISSENTFINVGNHMLGDNHASDPIINFQSLGNKSVSDVFDRFDNVQVGKTAYNTVQFPLVKGHASITNRTPAKITVTTASSVQSLFVMPLDTSSNVTAVTEYVFTKSTMNRTGKLYMSLYNGTVSTRDEYAYQGASDGSIIFSGTYTNNTLVIRALNNVSGTTGTIILSSTIVY